MDSFRSFHSTCQGFSHIEKGQPCQDAAASKTYADYSIAIVCDGHGGKDYIRSKQGSLLASEAVIEQVSLFMENREHFNDIIVSQFERIIKQLERSIVAAWHSKIEQDLFENPFTPEELALISEKQRNRIASGNFESAYGTTLIVAVLTADYWFGLHQGDGKCVVVNNDGTFSQPIPWDERCYENVTTSLCDKDAARSFRHFISKQLPAAVFVATDGVDDSYSNVLDMNGFYKQILITFADKDFDSACEDVRSFLPKLSEIGSGDDISVSGIIDTEACKNFRDQLTEELETRKKQLDAERIEKTKKYIEWLSQFPKKFAQWKTEHPEHQELIDAYEKRNSVIQEEPVIEQPDDPIVLSVEIPEEQNADADSISDPVEILDSLTTEIIEEENIQTIAPLDENENLRNSPNNVEDPDSIDEAWHPFMDGE